MDSEKAILMYYHTALRNVGLYTSVSFVLLASSRFYRGKNKIYNIAFIVLSLAILMCAIAVCKFLIDDLKVMKKNVDDIKYLEKWELIPQAVLYLNSAVALIGVTTLFRQITSN